MEFNITFEQVKLISIKFRAENGAIAFPAQERHVTFLERTKAA